jgi:hypothetical protein
MKKSEINKLEHVIQDEIRVAIAENKLGACFRINVGTAWTGNDIKTLPDGSKLIKNPRPFKTGVQKGFTDLFVATPTIITEDMVGKKIAVACFIEVKTKHNKPEPEQIEFMEDIQKWGARAGVARSVKDAVLILQG